MHRLPRYPGPSYLQPLPITRLNVYVQRVYGRRKVGGCELQWEHSSCISQRKISGESSERATVNWATAGRRKESYRQGRRFLPEKLAPLSWRVVDSCCLYRAPVGYPRGPQRWKVRLGWNGGWSRATIINGPWPTADAEWRSARTYEVSARD